MRTVKAKKVLLVLVLIAVSLTGCSDTVKKAMQSNGNDKGGLNVSETTIYTVQIDSPEKIKKVVINTSMAVELGDNCRVTDYNSSQIQIVCGG